MKILENKYKRKLHGTGLDNDLLEMTAKAKATKETT